MKKIAVISPLHGVVAANMKLAEKLCREVFLAGHRPVAGHLFYTRFLDDADPTERSMGMRAGRLDIAECSEAWVYRRLGISAGMRDDIQWAVEAGIPIFTPPHWDVLP